MNEIRTDVSWLDYQKIDALNPSLLVHGLKSMLDFHHAAECPEDGLPSKNVLIGQLAHAYLLEPDQVTERFGVFEGRRYGKAWDDWQEANHGKEAVTPAIDAQAESIALVVRTAYPNLVQETDHEVTVLCKEQVEDQTHQCKGRIDMLGPNVLVDLKTTTNVDPHAFGRVFANLHYAAKLACYVRWVETVRGHLEDIYVIAVEIEAPWDCTLIPIPRPVLEAGWSRMEKVLKRVNYGMSTGHWPGVGYQTELVVPTWSMPEDDGLDWTDDE